MNAAVALKRRLGRALIEQSGLERQRGYLGMSQIGRCPRQLCRALREGRSDAELSDQRHWYCWTGYLHEAAIVQLLGGNPLKQNIEIVAKFDERYRGHVDYTLTQRDFAEIKSVNWRKFGRIRRQNQPDPLHAAQVQAYMHHGPWTRAFVIYLARDVPWREWSALPLWVFEIEYEPLIGRRLDEKARAVLAAVDAGVVLDCECGRCR